MNAPLCEIYVEFILLVHTIVLGLELMLFMLNVTLQRYGSFRKTADAEDSRRSREEKTSQIRTNKKDSRMAKRRQMSEAGLKKEIGKDKKDRAMSPCPMEVDLDASIDSLVAKFACMSIDDTSTPTKKEQVRHEMCEMNDMTW